MSCAGGASPAPRQRWVAIGVVCVGLTAGLSTLVTTYRLCVDVARPHMLLAPLGCLHPRVVMSAWSSMGLGGLPVTVPIGLGIAAALLIGGPQVSRVLVGLTAGLVLSLIYVVCARGISRAIVDPQQLPQLARVLIMWPQAVPITTLLSGVLAGVASGWVVHWLDGQRPGIVPPVVASRYRPEERFKIARRQRMLERGMDATSPPAPQAPADHGS